jgi:replicative DNA helicase
VSAASTGHPVWVYSGEMSKESWHDHSACVLAGLPTDNLEEPHLYDPGEKAALRSALRAFKGLPLWICDDASITLDHIIAEATRHVRQHGVEVVIVDYAQLVIAPGRDPKERVSAVAQRLRRFSKENNVAVILLSQLARPEGRNINHRPSMIDLKESGDLEAVAQVVLLNFCPVGDAGTFTGQDEIIVGKQRSGTIGSVQVTLNGRYSRFDSR